MPRYTCPACGFGGLTDPPWRGPSASFEICPSCGIQFGYNDVAGGDTSRRQALYETWRQSWLDAGRIPIDHATFADAD